MSARFTEAEEAEIDAARGTEDRGTWIRRVVLAALERSRPPVGAVDRQAEAVRQNRRAAQGECPPHPPARVHKGLCSACGQNVGIQP